MKITKYVHSCLLVEMPEPVNRTVLFDPGELSDGALDVESLEYLDNIVITHEHSDHFHMPLVQQLVKKFPDVRITTTPAVAAELSDAGIKAVCEDTPGIELFKAPHEPVEPIFPRPQQFGVHYLDMLTHPGDCHNFAVSKQILALPVTAPWGSTVKAVNLALALQPKYILPIHDWHWNDEARTQTYAALEKFFATKDITFCKLKTGEPIVLDV